MKSLYLLILLLGLLSHLRADKCFEHIKPMANFQLDRFTGNWLVYTRYPTNDWFERCTQWRFEKTNKRDDNSIALYKSTVNLFAESRSETRHPAQQIQPGEFDVQIRDDLNLRYLVLDTDYYTYAVMYTCIPASRNNELMKVWILTNGTDISPETLNLATDVMKRNNLTLSLLSGTAHENCFVTTSYADKFWIWVDKSRKWTLKVAKYVVDKLT